MNAATPPINFTPESSPSFIKAEIAQIIKNIIGPITPIVNSLSFANVLYLRKQTSKIFYSRFKSRQCIRIRHKSNT